MPGTPLRLSTGSNPTKQTNTPFRYGDLFATPDLPVCQTKKGAPWRAVQVLYPSCELGAKATESTDVLVGRVHQVKDMGANQRPAIRLGFIEKEGQIQIALANTFWLPPVPDSPDAEDQFSDFRCCQRVPLAQLLLAGRLAAMTHDARVALISREMYFKYRYIVSTGDVRALEAVRIAGDPDFVGSRPSWAE
jgi:hypothetical protein